MKPRTAADTGADEIMPQPTAHATVAGGHNGTPHIEAAQ